MPDILYEDNHVIVAVKPPNMLSQADKTGDTDILTWLKDDVKLRYQKPGAVFLGLVHRLDRPVGGLMVFARTSKAANRLSAQMREHKLGRDYLCIVTGEVKDSFTLINYLIKDEKLNRVSVCDSDIKGAQEAILHGKCLARRQGTALCAITLETGRNHQIRVQMAEYGAPLWGDNRYGSGVPGQQIALWGYKLSFIHPTTKELMTFMHLPFGGVWTLYQDLLADMWTEYTNPDAVRPISVKPFSPEAHSPSMLAPGVPVAASGEGEESQEELMATMTEPTDLNDQSKGE